MKFLYFGVLLVSCSWTLIASDEKYKTLLHEIKREREVSLFILRERVHAIELQLTTLNCYKLRDDYPCFLGVEYKKLRDDKLLLKNLIERFEE